MGLSLIKVAAKNPVVLTTGSLLYLKTKAIFSLFFYIFLIGDFDMIDIVIYYPYLDGTTTSLVDLWFNLNHYINVKCNIVVDTKNIKQNVKYFMQLKKVFLIILNTILFH